MFKMAGLLFSSMAAFLLLAGCGGGSKPDGTLVYASFYPMYDFAQKAAGGLAEVRCLIPDGTEAHDWEPTPRDIAGLNGADLFLYSGGGFEEWASSVVPQLKGVMAVETSMGIELIDGGDPHVWLAPQNAKRQFIAMCEALKEADPANAARYGDNQERWSAEFDKLDLEFQELGKTGGRIFVTHAAFGYLCEAYGLEQIAVMGFSPDAEPNPAHMAAAVRLAREYGAGTIFYEGAGDYKTALALASEIGAELRQLSPLEGLTAEQRDMGADYFSVMRENLAAIKEALS